MLVEVVVEGEFDCLCVQCGWLLHPVLFCLELLCLWKGKIERYFLVSSERFPEPRGADASGLRRLLPTFTFTCEGHCIAFHTDLS